MQHLFKFKIAAALIPLQKVPIWPTKYAHPTYEIRPSDLRKMPTQLTKKTDFGYIASYVQALPELVGQS